VFQILPALVEMDAARRSRQQDKPSDAYEGRLVAVLMALMFCEPFTIARGLVWEVSAFT
jgi:hypothetical protein